jgi:two-component system, LytTR family, sensor kinase
MKKSLIITLQIAYWFCYLLLLSVILALIFQSFHQKKSIFLNPFSTLLFVFTISPAVISFYGFYVFLIDFLTKKQFLRFSFYAGIVVLISILVTILFLNLFSPQNLVSQNIQSTFEIAVMLLILSLIHGSLGLMMKGFVNWYADIQTKKELTRKNLETELALIKAQIDPHFLFNTLNNIDVLIGIDAKKASIYLNKLSEIMRFMLYETKNDKILLEKEIEYIKKYIDLQRIRTANVDFVQLNISGQINNQILSPMTFMPFIENAFKHSISLKKGVVIEVNFKIDNKNIVFECKNLFNENSLSNHKNGLGNELIMRRLELIYPKKHELSINKEAKSYQVNLNLDLE